MVLGDWNVGKFLLVIWMSGFVGVMVILYGYFDELSCFVVEIL